MVLTKEGQQNNWLERITKIMQKTQKYDFWIYVNKVYKLKCNILKYKAITENRLLFRFVLKLNSVCDSFIFTAVLAKMKHNLQ